jgi:hypothetical protein
LSILTDTPTPYLTGISTNALVLCKILAKANALQNNVVALIFCKNINLFQHFKSYKECRFHSMEFLITAHPADLYVNTHHAKGLGQ